MATCATYVFEPQEAADDTFTNGVCFALPPRIPCGAVLPTVAGCQEELCKPLPYVPGDILTWQWQLPDRLNDWANGTQAYGLRLTMLTSQWLIAVDVVDADTGSVTPLYEPTLSGFVGWRADGTRFQQITVDTTSFPRAWRLKITLNQGLTERVEYTETYCRVRCEGTITVQAQVEDSTQTRCGGLYTASEFTATQAAGAGTLATLGTYTQYVPWMRLFGQIQWQGADIDRKLLANTNYPTQTTTTRRYTIYGGLLSPTQATQLLAILQQPFVTVQDDLGQYVYGQFTGTFARNLEFGRSFVTRFDLSGAPCIDNSGCN